MSLRFTKYAHNLEVHILRLLPGNDLKKEIAVFLTTNSIRAGCVLTAVGSLSKIGIRFAGKKEGTRKSGKYEIVSLVGTLDDGGGMHLHISVSDEDGQMIGGHLLEGNMVRTTAEIVIGNINKLTLARELELLSGYNELIILEDSIQE